MSPFTLLIKFHKRNLNYTSRFIHLNGLKPILEGSIPHTFLHGRKNLLNWYLQGSRKHKHTRYVVKQIHVHISLISTQQVE